MSQIPTVHLDGVPDPLPAGLPVIDVREQVEWDHGHIEGAVHVPLGELVARVGELTDAQTLVVCRSGHRSGQAVGWLSQQGYDVVNLDGGMVDWAAAGRPMVSENGQPPQVV